MAAGPGKKRVLFAVGIGSACSAGASMGLVHFAVCEDAPVTAAAKGASFMWGRRFTGNDIIGCVKVGSVRPKV